SQLRLEAIRKVFGLETYLGPAFARVMGRHDECKGSPIMALPGGNRSRSPMNGTPRVCSAAGPGVKRRAEYAFGRHNVPDSLLHTACETSAECNTPPGGGSRLRAQAEGGEFLVTSLRLSFQLTA